MHSLRHHLHSPHQRHPLPWQAVSADKTFRVKEVLCPWVRENPDSLPFYRPYNTVRQLSRDVFAWMTRTSLLQLLDILGLQPEGDSSCSSGSCHRLAGRLPHYPFPDGVPIRRVSSRRYTVLLYNTMA